MTDTSEYFVVNNLTPNKRYILVLYAANSMGPGNTEYGTNPANISGFTHTLWYKFPVTSAGTVVAIYYIPTVPQSCLLCSLVYYHFLTY